jgi:hypothetical protein
VTEPRRECDEAEVRRLVEMQALVDYLTDPGPMTVWPFEMTGRETKRRLRETLDRQRRELDELRTRQAKIAQGLVLLLRKELP